MLMTSAEHSRAPSVAPSGHLLGDGHLLDAFCSDGAAFISSSLTQTDGTALITDVTTLGFLLAYLPCLLDTNCS
jgi:hypothetical protein